jgi:anaerobic magnesium-protoporphyrin IX monomethyl ester cyclase
MQRAPEQSVERAGRPLRVLLVNAPPFEVVEPWYDAPAFGRHGLACLAGYLREQPGFHVSVIDAKLERLSFEALAQRARGLAPDLVGLTAFTNEIKPAARAAEHLKRAVPGVVTVIGGPHVTALPERTLREFAAFDVGVVGEGEISLHELCEAIRRGAPLSLSGVRGLVYREAGALRRTPERPRTLDLDDLPLPAWDLFPRAEEYWVMSARGCPFTCSFCQNPNGRLARPHSAARAMAEIRMILDRYRPKKLWFADEIFGVSRAETEALLAAMIREGTGERVSWWAESHVRFVDEALFAKMKEAGCVECGLGIESGDASALKDLGKGTTVPMVERAFEAARRAGIATIGFFIFGHPNETAASMRRTIDLAVRLNPTLPIFGVMVPYPGTEVARLAARGEAGYRLLTDDWDAYNKQVGGALSFAGLSRREIELWQARGYIEVFVRNGRLRELGAFLWKYRVAGARVAQKLLGLEREPSGGADGRVSARDEIVEPLPPVEPMKEASRREIAEASEAWAARQAESVRALRAEARRGEDGKARARRLTVIGAGAGAGKIGSG